MATPDIDSTKKCQVLVLDTVAFIEKVALHSLAEDFVTVPEVLKEVKDTAAREALANASVRIRTVSPTPEAFQHIIDYAKKTGDYPSLSVTDLKVLALTYMLHQEHQAKEPVPSEATKTEKRSSKSSKWAGLPGFVENDEDDDAWIGIENLAISKTEMNGQVSIEAETDVALVACLTSDYAMQNTLLQMNLNLISIDGKRVKGLRNSLLRCHACFTTTMNMEKRFCPKCGNPTLLKTSYSIENGELKIHLKKNFRYRLRGTMYSIPKPVGNTPGIILREDQKEYKMQQKIYQSQLNKLAKKDWDDAIFGDSPIRPPTIGRNSRNLNGRKSKK